MTFRTVFFYDPDYDGYVAEVLDLPGCFSQGKTLEEAKENIKDAIRGVLFVMERNGEPYQDQKKEFVVEDIAV